MLVSKALDNFSGYDGSKMKEIFDKFGGFVRICQISQDNFHGKINILVTNGIGDLSYNGVHLTNLGDIFNDEFNQFYVQFMIEYPR